jgi:hypothetical protein
MQVLMKFFPGWWGLNLIRECFHDKIAAKYIGKCGAVYYVLYSRYRCLFYRPLSNIHLY